MLDNTTKQKIDTLRDILVGKVSDPKSQVEQITIALFYKFMWDMDNVVVELGGKPTHFSDDYAQYSWDKLFDPSLGGEAVLALYKEAVEKMENNPHIPDAFRDIFRRAYLPYNDPSTLRMFLKVVNDGFHYSHSEMLGDAFEYLLSILGTQGDAGQFRTPRHIIDFITECVNPQKGDVICDPACGTAGFVISAYKHILKQNTDKKVGDKLSPSDRKKLGNNLIGLDIDPMMVKLALANMYLHGFQDPHIYEYDSLTNEDRWNDTYDVVLANPPFMTPKGGIRPHKRFTTKANKAEVLFVDLIATHLSANGRAGIVVPNGIVATTQNAYKSLRKLIIEDSLIAVISLPAGVFQPYSGVKTSILILDKAVSKKTDNILFVKVENDGYDLGSQRRPIDKNDLPNVLASLNEYKTAILKENEFDAESQEVDCLVVEKKTILENRDVKLSGNRYRGKAESNSDYDIIPLGNVADILGGYAFKSSELLTENHNDEIGVVKIGNVSRKGSISLDKIQYISKSEKLKKYEINIGDVLIAMTGATVGKVAISQYENLYLNQRVGLVRKGSSDVLLPNYLAHLLMSKRFYDYCQFNAGGGAQGNISPTQIKEFQIPLPPLDVQEQIVAEIEGYQKIIDGARMVVDNYKPTISIKPHWEMVELGSVCEVRRGSSPRPKGDKRYYGGDVPRLMISDITRDGMYVTPTTDSLTLEGAKKSRPMKKGDVIMAISANPGLPTILSVDCCIHDGFVGYSNLSEKLDNRFFYFSLLSIKSQNEINATGATFQNLTTSIVKETLIPVPPIDEQLIFIKEIEQEQEIVNANKQLIAIYEQKIQKRIAQVWGEE